jgi:hypothetical protein
MAYTTIERVQRAMGAEFTADQAAEASALLGAADAWIDSRAGRTWGGAATPVVGELHTLYGDWLYLNRAPVSVVTSAEVRYPYAGSAWAATPLSGWELVNPATGHLLLPRGYAGWWARVGYTPAQVVDPRISLAATKLVAHWLAPVLSGSGGAAGAGGAAPIKSYTLGEELVVQYDTAQASATAAAAVSALGVPTDVVGLVDSLREVIVA